MTRRAAALALVALFATGACSSGSDDTSGATTTSSPARPSSTTTTSGGVSVTIVPATDATEEQILAGVAAGSAAGATLLPDEQWVAGVRTGCGDLPELTDGEITDFFEAFRIQLEDDGASREVSWTAVEALVGGFTAACPDLGVRLRSLLPAS